MCKVSPRGIRKRIGGVVTVLVDESCSHLEGAGLVMSAGESHLAAFGL